MTVCEALHEWANCLFALRFPFTDATIPSNGIYVLFEHGEVAHGTNRTVRVGTHTGTGQLRSRLRQHFLVENKDRSIFRKIIGRALLNRDHDPFLPIWELDRTSRLAREKHVIDLVRQSAIEANVSQYIQEHFTFVVFRVDENAKRLELESKGRHGSMKPTGRLLRSCNKTRAQILEISAGHKRVAWPAYYRLPRELAARTCLKGRAIPSLGAARETP